jgi:hypothetical protein
VAAALAEVAELIGAAVEAVCASGEEKVVAGGAAGAWYIDI